MTSAMKPRRKAPAGDSGGAEPAADFLSDRRSDCVRIQPRCLSSSCSLTPSTAVALGPDTLFSVDEASAILRRSPATLEKWRADAIWPRAVKPGYGSVAYRLGDLRDFIRHAEASRRVMRDINDENEGANNGKKR